MSCAVNELRRDSAHGVDADADRAPSIVARDVRKTYDGGRVVALDGATLSVAPGEIVALMGPSGSGKSTLLHLLAGLEQPDAGSLRVEGVDLGHLRHPDRYRRFTVGLVFQLHNLLPHLSVRRNVEVAMMSTHRRDAAARADELLREIGLDGYADRRPPELSGGQRQRVAIARALANEPRVLLADEPTGSLDSASVSSVLRLFHQLRDEHDVTIVIVTHDEQVAAAADRTLRIRDGRIDSDAE
jgi:putative ABC transport system ATP-binding protein